MTQIVCGVDVSKARLDACIWPGNVVGQFANSPAGIDEIGAFCSEHGADLVVMESTGGWEKQAFALLSAAGRPCALVNPARVRCFAQAMGALEKTDAVDAAMIARFALARTVAVTPLPSPMQGRLTALVRRLRQVTDDLTVHRQRRSSAFDDETLASLDEVIALLKTQRRTLEGEIASMIDDDPLWARLNLAFREVKGVADRTVARLMADLPEIGLYSNKAIAKLVGLAPLADDSGQRQGRRHIRGGRASVRSILFLVSDIARKYDDSLNAFHRRLSQAGKPKMVVRIAVAHKLLVRLNAKARLARAEMLHAT